jgi:hypothetical protein
MIKARRQDSGLSVVRSIAADSVLILMGTKCDVDEREASLESTLERVRVYVDYIDHKSFSCRGDGAKIPLERPRKLYRVGVRGQQRLLVGKWGFPEIIR